MPDLEITIADRTYWVACQAGEEPLLQAAAKLLHDEATPLQAKIGRLPEVRMLLMAGLMLADRTSTLRADLNAAQERIAKLESQLIGAEADAMSSHTQPDHLKTLETFVIEAETLAEKVASHLV